MAFLGYTPDGVPVFEFLADVPDTWIHGGKKFGLMNANLPFSPAIGNGYPVQTASPAAWVLVIALVALIVVCITIIFIFSALASIFGPKDVKGIDINGDGRPDVWADACGCILNPSTDSSGHPILVPADPNCACQKFPDIAGVLAAGGVLILIGAGAYIGVDLYRMWRRK